MKFALTKNFMKYLGGILIMMGLLFQQCTHKPKEKKKQVKNEQAVVISPKIDDAITILHRKQIPVLCYHHLRDYRPGESSSTRVYIVPVEHFIDQIKMLADSGYHSITPAQYYAYLTTGAILPSRPIMISFDDTHEAQFTVGASELDTFHFKGVFFIMTVSIGRPGYMSKEEIKSLSDRGHVIAAHTWDHHNVKKYGPADFDVQLANPKHKLEQIIGKPVEYFAYPFGEWNEAIIPELKKTGYKAAFQLRASRDSTEPLYTIRRIIVPGTWDGAALNKWMKIDFH
jgi:peptidoglycan/xylan/chitin deacetylase (PgdA/CDA1 family)